MLGPRERAGRLAAVLLAVGGGRALLALLLRGADVGVVRLAAAYGVTALLAWLLPWERMRRGATLVLALAGFALVAFSTALGLVPDHGGTVPFMLVFAWVGTCHPRGTSVALLPAAGVAYALPLVALGQPLEVRGLLLMLGGCVLIAEVIAYAMDLAARSTARAEQSARAFGVVARASAELHHLDADRVLDAVADAVLELGYDGASLAVLDEVEGTFRCSHERGCVPSAAGEAFPLEGGVTGEVRRTRAPVVVDYQCSGLALEAFRERQVRTNVAVPVFCDREVVAVLHASTLRPRPVLDEEVEALRILAATAGTALENAQELQAERSTAERYARAAVTDALTGVGNRRRAHQVLDALRPGDTVVMIDLDGFKDVNDRLGHAAGDQVLRALAAHLSTSVREHDRVARYGGEEFLLVLRDAAPDQAEATVDRLLESWRRRAPVTTFSAGVAHHRGGPPDLTLGRADEALYAAKAAGRDAWRTWDATELARSLRPA